MSKPVVKPFGTLLTVAQSTTGVFRAPLGFVFRDVYVSNVSDSGLKLSISKDRNTESFIDYSDDDRLTGETGISFNFAAISFYWSSTPVLRWLDVGSSELRSIQYENGGWSTNSLVIWGVCEPDPRCFG